MAERRYTREDLERNEDPEAIAGAVSGAAGAGVGAGIGLAALGPVGAIAGALAGAIGGWWAGKGVQRAASELDAADNEFRHAHEHAGATHAYEEVRHAYQLGFLAGRNPRSDGASFSEQEEELRAAWVKAHNNDQQPVPWDEVREYAQDGFAVARRS